MTWADHRANSRIQWGKQVDGDHNPSYNDILLGCALRSADALELMAKNHAQLVADRDRFERWYKDEREKVKRLYRRDAALRGIITKLKRAAARKP